MKMNDFYEVDGCMDFIPVTIVGKSEDGVIVTPANDKRDCKLVVEEVYRLPKPQEPQKPVVPKFVAQAWLDGYTVEQEKLYIVEIPNPNLNAYTVLQKTEKGIVLISVTNARWRGWESSKLTESEIKKDFYWAWQWAKEVE